MRTIPAAKRNHPQQVKGKPLSPAGLNRKAATPPIIMGSKNPI